jgi:hypothetical protein
MQTKERTVAGLSKIIGVGLKYNAFPTIKMFFRLARVMLTLNRSGL